MRGCAGGSDRRERKATPIGVFGQTRKRTPGAWGNPNKRAGISQKDIPAHCLLLLSEISDNTGYRKIIFIGKA